MIKRESCLGSVFTCGSIAAVAGVIPEVLLGMAIKTGLHLATPDLIPTDLLSFNETAAIATLGLLVNFNVLYYLPRLMGWAIYKSSIFSKKS